MKDILISFRLASVLFLFRVQVAEENGMEVLDQLAANPVSTSQPLGVDTLSSQQEDRLSTRYVSVSQSGGRGGCSGKLTSTSVCLFNSLLQASSPQATKLKYSTQSHKHTIIVVKFYFIVSIFVTQCYCPSKSNEL